MTADPHPSELFSVSDEALREATGRTREEWFALLDAWGAPEKEHGPTAAWLVEGHGLEHWWAQTVTVDYERARGLRPKGGHRDGTYDANASKTVGVSVGVLYEAVVDPAQRVRWLPVAPLDQRTAQPNRSARFDWSDGTTRVHFYFKEKSAEKSQVSLQHVRLPDAESAEVKKVFWRERLRELKKLLEG